MLSYERQVKILDILKQRECATVQYLCKALFASPATIRRDLERMSQTGMLSRVRGGAAITEGINSDAPLLVRSQKNIERKRKIARLAQRYIRPGSTVFMDSSSTVTELARSLSEGNTASLRDITVITDGIVTLNVLNEIPEINVYCSGGRVQNQSTVVGPQTIEFFQSFHADVLFFSCCGFSLELGTTEASEEAAAVKRAMCRSARQRILLCDATKFNSDYFCRACGANEIDLVLTDEKPPEEFLTDGRCRFVYEQSI